MGDKIPASFARTVVPLTGWLYYIYPYAMRKDAPDRRFLGISTHFPPQANRSQRTLFILSRGTRYSRRPIRYPILKFKHTRYKLPFP